MVYYISWSFINRLHRPKTKWPLCQVVIGTIFLDLYEWRNNSSPNRQRETGGLQVLDGSNLGKV
jgi:hypothetical protein